MSNISGYLSQILQAIYGRDVRQAIHDAIQQCYDDVNNPDLNSEAFRRVLYAAIDSGTLTALTVADGSIVEEKLADGAVTRAKIANNSVTTQKVVDAAITMAKLADLAVSTEKVADKAVTMQKLGEDVQEAFSHINKDIETMQTLYKALGNNVDQAIAASKNHANGFAFGEDGLLYLTHDGEIISAGIKVASSGGGLAFNGGYQDEEGFIHLTIDGEDIEGFDPFKIAGGSGGGGESGSRLVFAMYSASAFSVLSTSTSANVRFRFTSTDSTTQMDTGAGNLSVYVGGILKENMTVPQGESTIDVLKYLATGSNTVRLVMTDSYGATATRNVVITLETFTLEWNLGETERNSGTLTARVTPVGSGSKRIHLLVDGTELETKEVTTSGRQIEFSVPLSIGAHIVSVYGTMTLSGITLTSETLSCAVAEVSETGGQTVIAAKLTQEEVDQYSTINMPYRVINPNMNPADVTFTANGEVVASETVDQSEHVWTYRATNAGQLRLAIQCGGASWSKTITVNELSADISEITDNLAFKIDPNKINDLDSYRQNGVTLSVNSDFDSHNGGLTTDEDGIRCIKVSKGDRLTVNYNLFGTDARVSGRNMKFIYKVENASDFDGSAISCKNGRIGIDIKANSVTMSTEQTTLSLQTCEGVKTELELNIEPDTANRLMMFWEKGTPSGTAVYATNDNFRQASPVGITIGSDTCDVYLYMMRVYTRDLTREEIKANFYADGQDALEITQRYDRNQVYDSSGKLDPDKVARLNPNLHVITWHAAAISEAKDQKITGQLTHKYVAGGAEHSWTASGVEQKAQGTSSLGYVQAGCNEDFNLKSGIDLEDGTHLSAYAMTDKSIPVSYLNFKSNVASQEHVNNILLADLYNTHQPYQRAARRANRNVRDTIEGHIAVMFFHNTGDTAVRMGPYTVQPDETVFYSLGALNNSKKNEEVFKYDDIVIELRNNTSDQCRMKSADLSGEDWSGDVNFEFRYLNEEKYTQEQAAALWQQFLEWVVSMDSTRATNSAFATPKVVAGQSFTIDSADYRRAAFKAEAPEKIQLETFTYDQVFNLLFSCVDNNVKNAFYSYDSSTGKWGLEFAYDRDTAMGNDNEGGLTLKYGYMDTDTVGSKSVFNGADSTIRCMIRECFATELRERYIAMENAGLANLDSFAEKCEQEQGYACESLWIEDAYRKDIDTYVNLSATTYISMQVGKKRLQRRQFLHYQRAFISSYFMGSYTTSDMVQIRGYTPSEWHVVRPESKMTITPYSDLWVVIRAGSQDYQRRAYAGQPVEIALGSASFNDTEIYVRAAGFIAGLGNLAHLYPGLVDVSPAKRLQELSIGSSASGYQNTNLQEVSVRNAKSLEYINIENCPNFMQELDLSQNVYVKECRTKGSGATGVTFAPWGRLEKAVLNAVSSIFAENLNHVEEFSAESYDNLSTLNMVGGKIDALAIATAAVNLNRVRLKDMAWRTTIRAYKTIMRLHNISGIDDDGHNTANGVLTGTCYFDAISVTKFNALVEAVRTMTFTYGETMQEHTVTFCNEDGSVIYAVQVEHGGAVDDPIKEGLIGTPTKDPDVEYVYTFYKWDIDLSNIIGDCTATATYTRAQRSNLVIFQDWDGSEIQRYTVAAHGSCGYVGPDLVRSGYIWTGWDQATNDVVSDMIVKATYIYPTAPTQIKDMQYYDYAYSDDPADNSAYTFAEFYSIQKMGRTLDFFPVGTKCKMVPVWDVAADTSIIFELHSAGHYELAEGGMSHADWYMKGLLAGTRQMNTTGTNKGGWNDSAMRKFINETLYPAMDPKWRNLIAQSITLASAGNQTQTIVRSVDRLRIPSHAEVGFDVNAVPYTNEISPDAQEKTFRLFTDNNSRIKKTFNGTGAASTWWLRSADAASASAFRFVNTNGTSNSIGAYIGIGVCLGFSV